MSYSVQDIWDGYLLRREVWSELGVCHMGNTVKPAAFSSVLPIPPFNNSLTSKFSYPAILSSSIVKPAVANSPRQ
jgi:hypothetical protein